MVKIDTPEGYEVSFGGQAQMMAEMQQTVLGILMFAIFFSFVVLAVQFNSLKLPAIILGSVPFCLVGLVFIMLFTGLPLGATVIIGVLVIVASMVNEGVLLLTYANELRDHEGLRTEEAVLKATKIRFGPRVIITAAILVGFIPLALALEEGADMLQPMATAAIGGLLMGILVALFLMPCLYVMLHRTKG